MSSRDIEKAVSKLFKVVKVIGWSNKIRNGKLRVYVEELPPSATLVRTLKVGKQRVEIEYVVTGKVVALSK